MRALSLLSMLALTACGEQPVEAVPGAYEPEGDVVLTVDGHELHEDAVELALDRIPAPQRAELVASGQLKPMIEKMALGEVLYHRAIEQGLHRKEDVQLRISMAERDALAQALVDRVLDDAITDEKLRAAYDERKVQFAQPQAAVSIMLLKDEATARQVHQQLQEGGAFAALAREHSVDRASGEAGGDFGWVVKGQLAEPVDQVVFGNQGTGVLEPMQVSGAWFLVEVRERRDLVPFEEVRDQLEGVVQQKALEEYLSTLEQDLTIEWKQDPATMLEGIDAPAAGDAAAPDAAAQDAAAPDAAPSPSGDAGAPDGTPQGG